MTKAKLIKYIRKDIARLKDEQRNMPPKNYLHTPQLFTYTVSRKRTLMEVLSLLESK